VSPSITWAGPARVSGSAAAGAVRSRITAAVTWIVTFGDFEGNQLEPK
jgi:hypothetical protein